MKMAQRGAKDFCTHCLQASVPVIKKCLPCGATLCLNHLRLHSESTNHTLTDVRASSTIRRCPHHNLDFSLYCRKCKTCLCSNCKGYFSHIFHGVVQLRDAHEAKKNRLNEVLVEFTTKREQIPDQIHELEMARDQLNRKIGNIVSLVINDDPLTVLQEKESERSDFCNIQLDSERRIREIIQEEHKQFIRKMFYYFLVLCVSLCVLLLFFLKLVQDAPRNVMPCFFDWLTDFPRSLH